MDEFNHFTICHFCTAIISHETHLTFTIPREDYEVDLCDVCTGGLINKLSTVDKGYFVKQREIWEDFGRLEEEKEAAMDAIMAADEEFMEGDEWSEEQKRRLKEQEDNDIYKL